jgi:hypothetical protein
MTRRVPGVERMRDASNDLIHGRLRVENAKSELAKLTTRLILRGPYAHISLFRVPVETRGAGMRLMARS